MLEALHHWQIKEGKRERKEQKERKKKKREYKNQKGIGKIGINADELSVHTTYRLTYWQSGLELS